MTISQSMQRPSRRTVLLSSAASLLSALPLLSARAAAPPVDALQKWLRSQAIAIRSIDAADEDFRDLEPLIASIGDARVVQLGEPSHGAGSSFAAKVRLVKFLHQRLGFDVLAWESGFYDLERTQAALRSGLDAVAAAQLGILKIWSASAECRPLFDYAQASHASARPLAMAGFDMQFTAAGSFDHFAADLRSFVGAVRNRKLRGQAASAAETALAAVARLESFVAGLAAKASELRKAGVAGAARAEAIARWERDIGASLRPQKRSLIDLEEAADRLSTLIAGNDAAFAKPRGVRHRGFMARAIANLRGYGANLYEQYGADRPPGSAAPELTRENRRDAINAANLRWLLDEGHAGRKIIVWAHNAHVMNAYYGADFQSVSLEPQSAAMKPSGVYLADWLGGDLYTIGITTYAGEDGWVGAKPVPIAPASENSLEGRLHRLGMPYAFVDFRTARQTPDNPLRQPATMRLPKYKEEVIGNVSQPLDAIIYIDRMRAATLIG